MERKFEYIISVAMSIGVWVFGGFDAMMKVVLFCTVFDFLSGVVSHLMLGDGNARECANGIGRKVLMYMTIGLACILNQYIFPDVPLRETVIFFYIASEAISILENVGQHIRFPKVLRNMILSLNKEE